MDYLEDEHVNTYLIKHPSITYCRGVNTRYENFFTKKEIFSFTSDRLEITPLEYNVDVIENMYIINFDKITKINIFLVNKDIDINTLSIDTDDNENIKIIHKTNIDTLYSLNTKSPYLKKNMLLIPYNSKNFVPSSAQKNNNKKFVILVESEDTSNISLLINYLIPISKYEINRFSYGFLSLTKKIITESINIKKGSNKIYIGNPDISYAYFMIVAPKNTFNNIHIKFIGYNICDSSPINIDLNNYYENISEEIKNEISNGKLILIKEKLVEVSQNLEYISYENNMHDVYFKDPYRNLSLFDWHLSTNEIQAYGHYTLNNESCFEIDSDIDINIQLTKCIFDIIKYFKPEPEIRIVPEIPQVDDIPEIPDIVFIDNVNLPEINLQANVVQENEDNYIDNFSDYKSIFVNIAKIYEYLTISFEKASDDICVISLDPVRFGRLYYKCNICKKPFLYNSYVQWFRSQAYDKKCPHCSSHIQQYPKLYINIEKIYVYSFVLGIGFGNISNNYLQKYIFTKDICEKNKRAETLLGIGIGSGIGTGITVTYKSGYATGIKIGACSIISFWIGLGISNLFKKLI